MELIGEHQESTGLELADHFEKKTGEIISAGTLYTTLRRLCEEGWVTNSKVAGGDGRIRIYAITRHGRLELPVLKRLRKLKQIITSR